MKTSYRIRRVEHTDSLTGELSAMVRGVSGHAADTGPPPTRHSACFVALADKRIVGMMTLDRPDPHAACSWLRRRETAILRQFVVDPEHRDRGCGEALIDVALHWARVNEFRELTAEVSAEPADLINFLLSQGFNIVGTTCPPGSTQINAILSQQVVAAKLHSDVWFSPHRGMWFASMTRH